MRSFCICTLYSLWLMFFFSTGISAKEDSEQLKFHRQVLENAKIPLTSEGILAFFRSRTPSKKDIAHWKERINELGARDYQVREKATLELTRAGWPAMAYLQQASRSFDIEVARRAERCMEAIGRTPNEELLIAAASVTIDLNPKGAIEAILGCLPAVTEQRAREALYHALRVVDLQDNEVSQEITKAAKAENPILREAAAHVLSHAEPDQRKLAFELLTDPELSVRFAVALELVMAQERAAIPHLIKLLNEVNRAQSFQIEDILYHLAGDDAKIASPLSWDEAERRKYQQDWLSWWEKEGKKVDIARLTRSDVLLGLHLISELNGGPKSGRVFECGRDGKPRWQITTANGPIDARILPNGNVLIAEHGGRCVTIRDRKGREIWKHQLRTYAVACQQLRNGNIFVTHYNGASEITPSKKVLYEIKTTGSVYYGMKLRNGNVLLSRSNNQIVEMDTKGKTIQTIKVPGTGYWSSAEKLPNGRYLVACGSASKVVEVDTTGKIHWEVPATQVGHATRLPNGNTLITLIDKRKILEVNRAKKVVWEITVAGRPFHAYRR